MTFGAGRNCSGYSEYRRWESNPHGRSRPEDFKSSEGIDANPSAACSSDHLNDRFSLHLPYGTEFPPDLAAVVAAWPELPAALRAGIVAMVKASSL